MRSNGKRRRETGDEAAAAAAAAGAQRAPVDKRACDGPAVTAATATTDGSAASAVARCHAALPTEDAMREKGIHDVVEALTMDMKTWCLQDLKSVRERVGPDHVKARQKALRRAMFRGPKQSGGAAGAGAAAVVPEGGAAAK